MIYLTFVQYRYMKHRMQITQECWKYDSTTDSVVYATNDFSAVSM